MPYIVPAVGVTSSLDLAQLIVTIASIVAHSDDEKGWDCISRKPPATLH